MDRAFWDARYLESHRIWSGNPNPQLVDEVAGLPPGSALDVGCGEGADTLWLAQRGWRVTAVDISGVALERAREHVEAAGAGHRVTWVQADLTEGAEVGGPFDLVSAQFLQLPAAQQPLLHRRLAELVGPGGTLLVVAHHPSDLDLPQVRRPPRRDLFFTAEDVVAVLDRASWVVEVAQARPRPSTSAEGEVVTVRDTVVRARRAGGEGQRPVAQLG